MEVAGPLGTPLGHDGRGQEVPTQADGPELGAAAQGRQEGLQLGPSTWMGKYVQVGVPSQAEGRS